METEDVVHVLRHVHGALVARGRLLDVHPLGAELAVRAGNRGLGFVDTRMFARLLETMDEGVAQTIGEGLYEELRSIRRHVVERFDDAAELIEHADDWTNLRLPAPVRRKLRETSERPIELVDAVQYRLLAKRP